MGKVDVGGGKPLGPPLKVPVAAPPPKRIAPPPKVPTPGPAPKHVAPTGYSRTRPSPKTPDRGPRPKAPAARPLRSPGGDVQSGGYNFQSANRFKATPAYRNAIQAVFAHQPVQQKLAIVQGLTHNNTWDTPEGHAIKDYSISHLSQSEMRILQPHIPIGVGQPSLFSELGHTLGKIISPGIGNYGGKGKAGLPGGTIGNQYELFGGPKGQANMLKAGFNDAINLPGNTVQGIAKIVGDVGSGHPGNALHDLIDPYINLAQHPLQAIYQHPLNSALLFAGPEAAVGRGAGAIARSGALGERAARAADTARAPLRLGPDVAGAPNPILEHRSYSPNLVHRGLQAAREAQLQHRGIDPNVARPAPRVVPRPLQNALNIGLEAKTRRIADEMTAVRQMHGRENRGRATQEMRKVAPPKEVRHVVSHILQGVVRKPETAIVDLQKEINRLKAAQTGARTPAEILARRQIRDLSTALKNPHLLPQAFGTASAVREWLHSADKVAVTKALLDPEQAMRSKLGPYALAHMGAKYDHGIGLTDHAGVPLPNEAILQHLKDNGVPDPAYVGHYPAKGAFWQFYQRYKNARGSLKGQVRTYAAFRKGNYDHTYDALVAQMAHHAEAATKATLHDKIVSRLGITKPTALRKEGENGMFTPAEARAYAHASTHEDNGNPIPGAQPLVPISAMPGHSIDLVKDLQHPFDPQHVDGLELRQLDKAINEAASRTDGTRNVVLVPAHAIDQFKEQFAPQGKGARKVGQVTQQFRRTVLPYSTHWMTQIGSEAALRGLVAGVFDPRNVVAGRQLLRRLTTTEEGRAALHETVNATFYNKRDPLAIHNPNPGLTSRAAHAFPPTKALIAAHNLYADKVGTTMYQLEHQVRLMGLGKFARKELQEFTKSYQGGVRLQGKNLDLLVEKMRTDPALVAKLGRQIDETFGKYNKLSPQVRNMVQTVAPFLPWYLNAAKFVLWVLPAKHPVASSLLASLRQTINQDIQNGQQAPLNRYEEEALAKITPFGIYNPPEFPGVGGAAAAGGDIALSTFLPQVMGSVYNFLGRNSFGDADLKGPNGKVEPKSGQALGAAFENALEAFLPAVRYARLAQEGGKPAYGTSTVFNPQPKPGAGTSVLNRIFNPFYSFERAGSAGSSTGSSSSSGGPNLPNIPSVPLPNLPNIPLPSVR